MASTLPEEEQDALAGAILSELEAERHWDRLFDASTGPLDRLAEEALDEFRRGETKALDLPGSQ